MIRILLADDSPHAKRMGERILREEGFEVVTVTDGNTVLLRLPDVDPDVVLASVSLPGRSGYEICREVKKHERFAHIRVVLTAGLMEKLDENEVVAVRCDAVLKKPFEPSGMLEVVGPLAEAARRERPGDDAPPAEPLIRLPEELPAEGPYDHTARGFGQVTQDGETERVRAAVTLALDAALPSLIDEITQKLLVALRH